MSEYYLIKDYHNKDKDGKPALRLVSEAELWDEIDNSKEAKLAAIGESGDVRAAREAGEIAIYKLGQCVLDWS